MPCSSPTAISSKGTYDPRFESSYWMRIGLGVIAGLVLSQMIPIGPELELRHPAKPLGFRRLQSSANHCWRCSADSRRPWSTPSFSGWSKPSNCYSSTRKRRGSTSTGIRRLDRDSLPARPGNRSSPPDGGDPRHTPGRPALSRLFRRERRRRFRPGRRHDRRDGGCRRDPRHRPARQPINGSTGGPAGRGNHRRRKRPTDSTEPMHRPTLLQPRRQATDAATLKSA